MRVTAKVVSGHFSVSARETQVLVMVLRLAIAKLIVAMHGGAFGSNRRRYGMKLPVRIAAASAA